MIPKSGCRFPAFAKPASAGEGRSEGIMLEQKLDHDPIQLNWITV
jgi:hypothetical protein